MNGMTLLRLGVFVLLVAILSGCSANEPPFYEQRARHFLWKQGVLDDVITKLTKVQPLAPAEAEQLALFKDNAVLHLLGANPTTPQPIVERLAWHSSDEVKTGVAINPNASLELLLSMRKVGKRTTVNHMIARNPRISPDVLLQMHRTREAPLVSFGMNPNCPPELMRTIAAKGTDIDRAWLATNPNLPEDLAQALSRDSSPMVRGHFESNPKYGRKNGELQR